MLLMICLKRLRSTITRLNATSKLANGKYQVIYWIDVGSYKADQGNVFLKMRKGKPYLHEKKDVIATTYLLQDYTK
jgi:hypothetical protein